MSSSPVAVTCWFWLLVSFSVCILCTLGNIKLLFSEKYGTWSNGTVVLDLPMKSASSLKLSNRNLIIVFLVSSISQSRLLSFTYLLCTFCFAFMSQILFCTSQVSFIRESFNSRISTFKEENYSWKEFEKEVVLLILVSGVRILINNSGESGKVSLSLASGVLVTFLICGGSGKVWSDDAYDVWSTFLDISKESRPWMALLRFLSAFEASVFMI